MPAPISPAPFARRLLAAAVDFALTVGVAGLGVLREAATPAAGVFTFLGCMVAGVFWLARDAGGASPGKRLTRLVVRRADGTRVGVSASSKRNAAFGAALILGGVSTVVIADPFAETLAVFMAMVGGGLAVVAAASALVSVASPSGRRVEDRWARTHVEWLDEDQRLVGGGAV